MSKEKIVQELREYLNKEPNMLRSDRMESLTQIVDRHLFERNRTHVINRIDLLQMISNGGDKIAKMKMPVFISDKQMDQSEVRHVAMIEAIIGYMNRHGLLNREVNFDYTSDEFMFEPLED